MPPVGGRFTSRMGQHFRCPAPKGASDFEELRHHESGALIRNQTWRLRVLEKHLVECLGGGHYWQFRNLRNQPFHLAGLDFILRYAAGFARSGIDHRGRPPLQLPCPPRCYENVTIVTIEPFNQLHTLSPESRALFTACEKNPESAAPARVLVPAEMLVQSLLTALLLLKASPRFFFSSAPTGRCPSVGRQIAQARCLLIYSRISSNSQSLVGPCPTGDG